MWSQFDVHQKAAGTRFGDCKTFCRNATRAQKLSQLDVQDVKPSVKNLLGCFPRIPGLSVFKPAGEL